MSILCDPSMDSKGNRYVEFTDKTIKDEFKRWGLPLRNGHSNRLDGYTAIKELLDIDPDLGKVDPAVYISRKCRHLIKDLENAQKDDDKPDFVEKDGQYHALAAFRYLVMHIRKPHLERKVRDLSNTTQGVLHRLKQKRKVNLYAR